MAAIVKTEYGTITIDNEVIARIAGTAAMECYGVVGMASLNVKDGLVTLLLGDSLTKGIKVDITEEGHVLLDFHIVVEYGTKISAIADNLMSNVKYKVQDMLGVTCDHINVFVEGIRFDKSEE